MMAKASRKLKPLTWKSKRVALFSLVILIWAGFLFGIYKDSLGGASKGGRDWKYYASSVMATAERVANTVFNHPAGPSNAPAAGGASLAKGSEGEAATEPAAELGGSELPVQGVVTLKKAQKAENVIMTMIAGNGAARHAVAMVQSLRDVNTQADAIVIMLQRGGMGSPECLDDKWKRDHNRSGVSCSGPDTIPEEIVSPFYIKILKRLGCSFIITPEIPRTRYTANIAGGTQSFWGMSMNKMQIFNMTQYKKIIFLDSDTIMFQNIDHLFGPEYPMFTAAMTYSCCNRNSPPMISGGFWIVEPELKWGVYAWELMVQGMPVYNEDGTPVIDPKTGKQKMEGWRLSDLDLARAMFANRSLDTRKMPMWPSTEDTRHGYIPGLRLLPYYKNLTDQEFADESRGGHNQRQVLPEGFQKDRWDGVTPVWHALDVRYDQCVGMCDCLPGRDMREKFISVHYSCIEYVHKPGWYETEKQLMTDMITRAPSCYRYYYLEWYYSKLKKAGARLDPPYWDGPPVTIWNETLDIEIMATNKRIRKEEAEALKRGQ